MARFVSLRSCRLPREPLVHEKSNGFACGGVSDPDPRIVSAELESIRGGLRLSQARRNGTALGSQHDPNALHGDWPCVAFAKAIVSSCTRGPELVAGVYACFHTGKVAVPLGNRLQAVELNSLFQRLQPALYMGEAKHRCQVETIDSSILPHERRFVHGQTSEDNRMQTWENLFSDAPDQLPVEANDPTPAAPLRALRRVASSLSPTRKRN